ncbi:ATP-binding protein [Reichenbachiella sp.]|uniref:hybrid sensor histidine kinase/response regulator transcription factor n=1 Tax=Reichenbachiella sp. TaxID=2184521 RepID=UPI0032985A21
MPPLKVYNSADFPLVTQSWDAIQDDRGIMYFAASTGILEFDGENWKSIDPLYTNALEMDRAGVIYAGGYGDFGYLGFGEHGRVEFFSFKHLLPDDHDVEVVRDIHTVDQAVYFVSQYAIYTYDIARKSIKIIKSENILYPSAVYENKLIVKVDKVGICTLSEDSLEFPASGGYWSNKQVANILPFGDSGMITLSSENGAHYYSPDTAKGLPNFDHPFYLEKNLFGAKKLNNDFYGLCFLTGSFVITDNNFKAVMRLGEEAGIDPQVHNVFENKDGNLWLMTNSGLVFVNLTSQIYHVDKRLGFPGSAFDAEEKNGNLYVTGESGVYFKPWQKSNTIDILDNKFSRFAKVPNSGHRGLGLEIAEDVIFVFNGDSKGMIKNDQGKSLVKHNNTNTGEGAYDPNEEILITTSDRWNELMVFKSVDGEWKHINSIEDQRLPKLMFVHLKFDKVSNQFLGIPRSSDQLYAFRISKDYTQIVDLIIPKEVPSGGFALIELEKTFFLGASNGIYQLDPKAKTLKLDTRFGDFFSDKGVFFLAKESESRYWYYDQLGEFGSATISNNKKVLGETQMFAGPEKNNVTTLFTITSSRNLLIGMSKGFWVVYPDKTEDRSFLFKPRISQINLTNAGDSVLFSGVFYDEDSIAGWRQTTRPEINNQNNAMRFTFSIPFFKGVKDNEYRTRLVGFDENWSEWSFKNEKDYTNLPSGSFNFKVQARNVFGEESDVAEYNFEILPPWYGTVLAYVVYVILFGGFVWIVVKLNSVRLRKENEKLEHIILERTEEIRSQAEKLQKLDNAKSRFFANISHELRTPLTLIQGPIESILNGNLGKVNEAVKSNLDLSKASTKKLLNLVEEILDLSKLEAGKMKLNFQTIGLHDLLSRIFYTYQSSGAAKRISFQFNYHLDKDLSVKVDIGKLEKILDNLLSNALKFTEVGGSISLDVSKYSEQLIIKVEDNGIGMKGADLGQVFERFYQAGDEKKYTGGTGIGLSLSKELALLMEGELNVASKPNVGTVFTLSIPLVISHDEKVVVDPLVEEESVIIESKGNFEDPLNYKDTRILVVEDNEMMRKYIKGQIQESYLIDEAEDGIEALEKINTEAYDLIISDLMMPRLDGFDLVHKLKEDERTKEISVIMLTARSGEEDIVEGLTIGVDDYMTKPFNQEELKARIKNILENRNSRQEVSAEEVPKSVDDELVQKLKSIIKNQLNNSDFNVTMLADQMAISERQLTRNIKKVTGLTAGNFLKEVRLNEARTMLENKAYRTISEICYAVGFEKPGYFSEIFTKRFGKRPADYLA